MRSASTRPPARFVRNFMTGQRQHRSARSPRTCAAVKDGSSRRPSTASDAARASARRSTSTGTAWRSSHRRRTRERLASAASRRVRADDGQPARRSPVAVPDRAPARRRGRHQHLRQPPAVRAERGFRPLSAHDRSRSRGARARRRRRAVRAAGAGDVSDAAGLPRAAAAARRGARGRVAARDSSTASARSC